MIILRGEQQAHGKYFTWSCEVFFFEKNGRKHHELVLLALGDGRRKMFPMILWFHYKFSSSTRAFTAMDFHTVFLPLRVSTHTSVHTALVLVKMKIFPRLLQGKSISTLVALFASALSLSLRFFLLFVLRLNKMADCQG
jgi:hypothetical protein